MSTANPRRGYLLGIAAYTAWGLFPLYFKMLQAIPAIEIIVHRVLWSALFGALLLTVWKHPGWWRELRDNPRRLAVLAVSGSLIACNWLVYVWAVNNGRMIEASLGYYINPLVNVLLGTLLLGERLSRAQWVAVGIAALGVAMLAGGALTTLWISLTLALSFGAYGLVRKRVPVGSLPGLTIESALLLLPSIMLAFWYAIMHGSSFLVSPQLSASIVLGGVVTAVPLLLFALAARRMPYSTIGFIQFLAPSIVFILGLTVFDQPLQPAQAACFACIWVAAAVFAWDLIRRPKTAS